MYLSGPQADFGDRYQNEFLPAYSDVSGEEEPIAAFHAHAYDAYNIVADAIEAVGIDEDGTLYIPRTALKDGSRGLADYDGLTGLLTCNENGDCANSTITVRQVARWRVRADLELRRRSRPRVGIRRPIS